MTTGHHRLVRELFDVLSPMSTADRERRIAELTEPGHLVAIREVRKLLAAADTPGDSLMTADVLNHAVSELPVLGGMMGIRVGQYRLTRLIDQGGMGQVFEAEQESPRRTVAVKVMRESFTSTASRRRFELESQVLGYLQHPGIAQVYEAGVFDPGGGRAPVPYFAMEFIDGARTLIEHAAAKDMTVRGRLELFCRVCDALAFAHQRGVIHRDIKPANILVDASGNPKVIDFGVARVLGDTAGVNSMHTDSGQLLGTLRYMSPEQCEGDPAQVDTRSDVYALGVVLYELLTGRGPYELERIPLARVVEVIREAPPTPPSGIHAHLRGDTETILLKALEKNRDRRYQSAAELAADIRRSLADEPILAHPPSAIYQMRKFAKRHGIAVGGALALAVAIVAGLIATTVQTVRARAAETRAENRRAESEHRSYLATLSGAASAIQAGDGGGAIKQLEASPPTLRGWEWSVLGRMADQKAAVIETGLDKECWTNVSPEGSFIVQVDSTGSAVVVDTTTLKKRWSGKLKAGPVGTSRDGGTTVVVAADGKSVAAYDTRDWSIIGEFAVEHEGILQDFSFDLSGERIIIGYSGSAEVELREVRTGKKVWGRAVSVPKAFVCCSPSDGTVYVAAMNRLHALNPETGEQLRTFPILFGEQAQPNGIDVTEDGKTLIVAGLTRLWYFDAATGAAQGYSSPHDQYLSAINRSMNGRVLLTGSNDRKIAVCPMGQEGQTRWLLGSRHSPTNVGISGDGTRVFASEWGTSQLAVYELNRSGGRMDLRLLDRPAIRPRPLSVAALNPMRFSPDGRVAYGLHDHRVYTWDLAKDTATVQKVSARLDTLGSIDPGLTMLACGDDQNRVCVERLSDGERLWSSAPLASEVVAVVWRPDGKMIISCNPGELHTWNPADGAPLRSVTELTWGLSRGCFSLDSRRLITTAWEGELASVRSADTLEIECQIHTGSKGVVSACLSPDGSLAVTADKDSRLRMWDARTGALVREFSSPASWSFGTAFSPDGKRLAVANDDGIVHVFDPASGSELVLLRGYASTLRHVEWSPDSKRLACGAFYGGMFVWQSEPVSHANLP